MLLNWGNFLLEDVKVKGLKKAYEEGDKFHTINLDLKDSGKSLKNVMLSVAKKLNLSGKLKAYKGGAFGITFLWGEKTIKVTTSKDEAQMISHIINMQKKHDLSNIIHYDDIFKLKIKGTEANYWVILMEQIIPITSKRAPEGVEDFFNDFLTGFEGLNAKETEAEVKRISRELKSKDGKRYSKLPWQMYIDDMIKICKNYKSIHLTNTDMHKGNMGINKDGHLVSFDPMGIHSKKYKPKKLKV